LTGPITVSPFGPSLTKHRLASPLHSRGVLS
jgi:hypothetical protein